MSGPQSRPAVAAGVPGRPAGPARPGRTLLRPAGPAGPLPDPAAPLVFDWRDGDVV
ncbi:hypothetical protein ACFV2S_14045 [Streptomyces sp. NPDC059695]|uniref:hypothetical protein n=1 Tax=Streptomyces sp. NPDC059695 TaxID=3346910 RepID=UPI003690B2B8